MKLLLGSCMLAGCGGGHAPAQRTFDATLVRPVATSATPAAIPAKNEVGAAQIHVTWPSAPAAVRASTLQLSCGEQAPARARISTMGGVASAVVMLQPTTPGPTPHGASPALHLDNCLLSPRAIVQSLAGAGPLEIVSNARARRSLHVDRIADDVEHANSLASDAAGENIISLPWAGAALRLPIPTAQVVRISTDDDRAVATWVVAANAPWSGVTDDAGIATFATLAVGHYNVTAWLPPAAGMAGMIAHGEFDVASKATTHLSFDLASGAATVTSQPGGVASDSSHSAD